VEADLERLGARRSALDAALADPEVLGNFVELRRVTPDARVAPPGGRGPCASA
jgi:hypothetical protein